MLGGQTLVERAVAMLAAHCHEVIVVSRPGVALPPLAGARVVHDRPGPDAPLVGIATGLGEATGEECLVLACDLPFAGPLLGRILAAAPGVAAVGADPDGRAQALCGRYPRRAALAACEQLLGRGALAAHGLIDLLDATLVVADGEELLNVNTPEDLTRAAFRVT